MRNVTSSISSVSNTYATKLTFVAGFDRIKTIARQLLEQCHNGFIGWSGCDLLAEMRHDLLRHQLLLLQNQLIRNVSYVTAGNQHTGVQHISIVTELLNHCRRATRDHYTSFNQFFEARFRTTYGPTLKRAFQAARDDGFVGTDESSLVERLETVDVSIVMGSDRNIKITKPTDMELARLFAKDAEA